MQSTDQTSAALLLTTSFGKSAGTPVKPLSINEWARLTTWLKDRGLQPSSLLAGDFRNLLRDWPEKTVTLSRLEGLLDRGVALASALEKWQCAGLWILTRSDPEYPYRLKQRLAFLSPPVLFGCGNKQLLNKGGLAVVGSRNATGRDLDFTKRLGAGAAPRDIPSCRAERAESTRAPCWVRWNPKGRWWESWRIVFCVRRLRQNTANTSSTGTSCSSPHSTRRRGSMSAIP